MVIKKISNEEFEVESSKGDSFYKVKNNEGAWSCDCPAFIYRNRGTGCKHIEQAKTFEEDGAGNPKPLLRGNVIWVTEQEEQVLVPLIPLGWEWTDDYLYFMIADLVKLGYNRTQLNEFFGQTMRDIVANNSLQSIVKYTKDLGEKRRYFIEETLEKMKEERQ